MGELALADIQGNILRGYNASGASYLFFEVSDAANGRSFLADLVGQVQDATDWGDVAPTTATNIAVTFAGLRALGVDDALLVELPREFTEPMRDRAARMLDDVGASDPARWDEGIGTDRSHVLVVISAVKGSATELADATTAVLDLATANEVALVHREDAKDLLTDEQRRTGKDSTRREHFGWADGLGQPAIEGAPWTDKPGNGIPKPRTSPQSKPEWRPLKAGEFIHGYPDEDGQTVDGTLAPLLRNGTYMVYRKLYQDVVAFRQQLRRDSLRYAETLPDRDQLDDDQLYEIMASRVVGRWRDGSPVLLDAGGPDGHLMPSLRRKADHSRALGDEAQEHPSNDFRYIDDPDGVGCPLGAHIRRTNPRDALGWHGDGRMSERHRIIRRGMPYGPFLEHVEGQVDDKVDRGLIFVCFNASIERQFEVIQRQWCNDGNAFHLGNEKDYFFPDASRVPGKDPDRSPGPDGRVVADRFTIQGKSSPHFVEVDAPVVHTRGSEYLLMPGIAALRSLAAGHWTAESSPWPTGEKQLRERIVELATRQLEADYPAGVQPVHRDQHPKAHGCVEATFTVPADLPPALRVGIFAEARSFPAWVRFSSSASGPTFRSDEKPDAHGMAIKVCEVAGEKILPGERHATTQDFVLANSKVFFCRDASDYVELASRMSSGKLVGFFLNGPNPLRWRLRELRNLLVATRRKVRNPLAIQYWSQTPSSLGGLAVKYSASPREPLPSSGAASGENLLEEAMAEHLESRSSTFDFMVQVQGDPRRMPIDDPTVEWSERRSPFVTVATIHIPAQSFTSPEQKRFGENLSFTPWHSLPEHEPLGAINRIRRDVYEAISIMRHERNGAPRLEPGDEPTLS